MHSRIFQLESNPVDEDNRINEDTIPEWFTNSIADYVSDVKGEDRDGDIEWLMRTDFGKVCQRDGDKITFNIYVDAFFDTYFEQFKKAVEDLSKITFDQFVGVRKQGIPYEKSLEHQMFLLKDAYDDRFGFYVWYDDELYTMHSWMRQVKPCEVYYLGGIVDYHF